MDALLSQLPKCISRDLCDELAVNFCYLNSKAARKRLVRVLCETTRTNLQLLPFFCRVAAILSQVFPDVGSAVLKAQEDEFKYLQVLSCTYCYLQHGYRRHKREQLPFIPVLITLCCTTALLQVV